MHFLLGGYILGGWLKRTWTQPFTNISVPAWMEEGPHDDILGVIDRNKFLWLQNHETDFIYACWFPACLRPLLLYFLLPLNSQQNYNHWTAVFFGSSHHILPAICEITDPVCTIGRHKKTARLLRCPLDCPRTSLNLFATKFDQVLNILAKRQEDLDYILIDSCYLLLILFGWLMFLLVGAGGR